MDSLKQSAYFFPIELLAVCLRSGLFSRLEHNLFSTGFFQFSVKAKFCLMQLLVCRKLVCLWA